MLADYPAVESQASVADNVRGGIQASIQKYDAHSIRNWRTERINGKTLLTLVVLHEAIEEADGYGLEIVHQHRELALIDGVYTVRVWRQNPDGVWEPVEEYEPRNAKGQPWHEIPFTFVGAVNNDPAIGSVPLYDLAVLNIAHWRNSADYEESVFLMGQPQAWMSGIDAGWRDWMQEQGIYLGSRAPWLLPTNGQAGILQAAPNTLARQAMQDKENQMAALGARLLQKGGAVQTAYETASDDATAHSVLSIVCDNVSAAYTRALNWCGEMMGATGETSLSIPTDFVVDTLDAQELVALLQAVQAGKLPESDFWSKLREVGYIDPEKTDGEIREELDAQGTSDTDLTGVIGDGAGAEATDA